MEVKLYQNYSDDNVLSKDIRNEISLECILKHPTNIVSPLLEIQATDDLSEYNYMYIPKYHRYYYVTPTCISNNIWSFSGNADVLMSFNNEIRSLNGIVSRSQNNANSYLNDPNIPVYSYKLMATKIFPTGINNDTLYVTTVG